MTDYWLINQNANGMAIEATGPFDSVNWARAALQKAKEYWHQNNRLEVANRHFISDGRPDESELEIDPYWETPLSPDNQSDQDHADNCYCRPCCGI